MFAASHGQELRDGMKGELLNEGLLWLDWVLNRMAALCAEIGGRELGGGENGHGED